MTQMCPPGSILVANWHQSKDSKEYFSRILHKKRRRKFGMTNQLLLYNLGYSGSKNVIFIN